jgi:shikimate kinase
VLAEVSSGAPILAKKRGRPLGSTKNETKEFFAELFSRRMQMMRPKEQAPIKNDKKPMESPVLLEPIIQETAAEKKASVVKISKKRVRIVAKKRNTKSDQ